MKRTALILGSSIAVLALLQWCEKRSRPRRFDRLLALRGSGRATWADEHADEYVRRLREGWE